jgi:hypothetical protein
MHARDDFLYRTTSRNSSIACEGDHIRGNILPEANGWIGLCQVNRLARERGRGVADAMVEISYRRHRFPPGVIQHAVWLYLRFSWGIAALHRLHAARKLPSPRRPPQRISQSLVRRASALCGAPDQHGSRMGLLVIEEFVYG